MILYLEEHFYSPSDGMLVHPRFTPSSKFVATHWYSWISCILFLNWQNNLCTWFFSTYRWDGNSGMVHSAHLHGLACSREKVQFSSRGNLRIVWQENYIPLGRFISLFNRRATGFHKQCKLFLRNSTFFSKNSNSSFKKNFLQDSQTRRQNRPHP